jgi:hypothetical protein
LPDLFLRSSGGAKKSNLRGSSGTAPRLLRSNLKICSLLYYKNIWGSEAKPFLWELFNFFVWLRQNQIFGGEAKFSLKNFTSLNFFVN